MSRLYMTTRMASVSIIIPCYNAEKHLETAVRSACQQEGVKVEVIAVDDGSTDGTLPLLQRLSRIFPQLKVLSYSKNRGQAYAKNLGFQEAKGTYIGILDSDDYYTSQESLKSALEQSRTQPPEVIICGYLRKNPFLPPVPIIPSDPDLTSLLYTLNWQLLISAKFLRQTGLLFDVDTPQREDFPFVLRVLLSSKFRQISPKPLLVHVIRPGSVMRKTPDQNQIRHYIRNIEIVTKTLDSTEFDVPEKIRFAVAEKYLLSTLNYWARPLLQLLDSHENKSQETLLCSYLSALHGLTKSVPAYSGNLGESLFNFYDPARYSGQLDLLRLVSESLDLDSFRRLLSGRKIHHSKLRILTSSSQFAWSERAVTAYLRHSQSEVFPEEPPLQVPISDLVRRVVIHIGYPKTGSSSIQYWMEENRFKLLEFGVWYPIYGIKRESGLRANRTSGHSFLIRQLLKKRTAKQAIHRLAGEISALSRKIDTLFVSSEMILSHHFWHGHGLLPREPVIDGLIDTFSGTEIDMVALVRPPGEWAEAYYNEILSNPFNGYSGSFLQFSRKLSARGLLNPSEIEKFIKSHPEINHVVFADYEQLEKSGGSIPFVLDQLGLGSHMADWEINTRINKSMSDSHTVLIRDAKRQGYSKTKTEELLRKITVSSEEPLSSTPLITEDERETFVTLLNETKTSPRFATKLVANLHGRALPSNRLTDTKPGEQPHLSIQFSAMLGAKKAFRWVAGVSQFRELRTIAMTFARKAHAIASATSYRGGKIALHRIRRGNWNFASGVEGI